MSQPSEQDIAAFLTERPYYARDHVEEIARACAADSIPFCGTCKDWHRPDQEHSSEGDAP